MKLTKFHEAHAREIERVIKPLLPEGYQARFDWKQIEDQPPGGIYRVRISCPNPPPNELYFQWVNAIRPFVDRWEDMFFGASILVHQDEDVEGAWYWDDEEEVDAKEVPE